MTRFRAVLTNLRHGFGSGRRTPRGLVRPSELPVQPAAKRPGRRPGRVSPERGAIVLLVLGGLGLSFLRSHVNLSILGDSQRLAESRRAVAASERDVDRVRVSVERLAAIDRIEPEARRSGFERPPAEAVMLLSARASEPPIPEARPLGVPGAGALGRWLEQAAKAARVPAAAADPGEGARRPGRFSRRDRAGERDPAPDRASLVAAARGLHAGEHGERGSRCDHCRALAAGQTSGH